MKSARRVFLLHSLSSRIWKHYRSVYIRSGRAANELISPYEFIITNLTDAILAEQVYQTYWKICTIENFIKEA